MKCMVYSQSPLIGLRDRKPTEMAIFACVLIIKKICIRNQQKSHVKNYFLKNITIRLRVHEKNFELALEFKICFGKLLQVHGYPQKQTGWSYDAWIDFYCDKCEM